MKAQIFLQPNEQMLAATDKNGLFTTIDTLICHDCFSGNNVMRAKEGAPLFWEWAILRIGGIDIPLPYHTKTDDMSVLYDWQGQEVEMTHTECVWATAKFFLSHMYNIVQYVLSSDQVNPMYARLMSGGDKLLDKIGEDKFFAILEHVDNNLTKNGWKVNN